MNVIGISESEKYEIHRILAIILWLGNLNFYEGENDSCGIEDPAGSFYIAYSVINFVASLMGVEDEMLEKVLFFCSFAGDDQKDH